MFQNSALQFQALSELRINLLIALQSTPSSSSLVTQRSIDFLTRHIRLFGKFFRRLQQLAVNRFVALPLCSDLVLYYWSKVVQATNGPSEYIAGSSARIPCSEAGHLAESSFQILRPLSSPHVSLCRQWCSLKTVWHSGRLCGRMEQPIRTVCLLSSDYITPITLLPSP